MGEEYATKEGFEEAYVGEYKSEEDFAMEYFYENYAHEIPEYMRNQVVSWMYYERIARDLFIGDFFSGKSENYTIYVFYRL